MDTPIRKQRKEDDKIEIKIKRSVSMLFWKRVKVFYDLYRNRNMYTVSNETVRKNHVNLNWYAASASGACNDNLGDYLSCVIVEYMKSYYSIDDTIPIKKQSIYTL